jgi:hypothetical protein
MDVAHPKGVGSSLVLAFFDTAKLAAIVVFRIIKK